MLKTILPLKLIVFVLCLNAGTHIHQDIMGYGSREIAAVLKYDHLCQDTTNCYSQSTILNMPQISWSTVDYATQRTPWLEWRFTKHEIKELKNKELNYNDKNTAWQLNSFVYWLVDVFLHVFYICSFIDSSIYLYLTISVSIHLYLFTIHPSVHPVIHSFIHSII